MKHLSDADILERLYLPDPGERDDHLVACAACAARLALLAAELREDRGRLAARVDAKPAAFWDAQRAAIAGRIRTATVRPASTARWAAAAALVVLLGAGWFIERGGDPGRPADATATVIASAPAEPEVLLPTADPWAAEELAAWEEAVQWESWLEPEQEDGA
ncbi:MAG: hypothetical protein ACRD2J_01715 [Thermoanaerobaculia bacterium]